MTVNYLKAALEYIKQSEPNMVITEQLSDEEKAQFIAAFEVGKQKAMQEIEKKIKMANILNNLKK